MRPANRTDRIAILGTVTPGLEHYCPILAQHLDAMWPSHPPLYYSLPAGRSAPYARVIQTDATAWTDVLLAGLEHLRRELRCSHAFVLLEDHVPLRSCDGELLEELFRIALDEDLRCVYFCMHEWPWQSTEHQLQADGRVRGWPKIDVAEVRGQRLARMPRNDLHYNRCQPALWKLDYYIFLVAEALRSGIGDPWGFETFRIPDQPQHFVSEYRWPSRLHGYRRTGKVYLRSLYLMKMPEGRPLRDLLLAERFPDFPRRARQALGGLFGFWGRMRGVERWYERRPSARSKFA